MSRIITCNTPAHIAGNLANSICVQKVNGCPWKILYLGILAGVYISFGAAIATLATSDLSQHIGIGLTKIIGGSVFSVGLILVVIAGAELFTGNNLMLMSVLDKKANLNKMLFKWLVVFVGNFIGAIFFVFLMYQTELWKSNDFLTGVQAIKIANAKVNLSFSVALFRGICCNWLVCLAVWMALAARNTIGKIFAIYFPIMTFVALGFEHSIANMFFIPMGIALKGTEVAAASGLNLINLNWSNFITLNLLPVTLGNIIGGSFFVGWLYWLIYVKDTSKITNNTPLWNRINWSLFIGSNRKRTTKTQT